MSRYRSILCYVITFVVFACLSSDTCLAQRDRFRPAPVPNAGTDADSRRDRRIEAAALQAVQGSAAPWLGIQMKDTSPRFKTQGALVEAVSPGSPAEKAGLTQGDIITSLDGKPVTSSAQVTQLVAGLKIGTDYPITVVRGSSTINLTVRPEALPASNTTLNADAPAPRKGPLDINTLKYALIDPRTRVVTFIGKYDTAYNTGPIPYADLLKDVMENPYPSLSIEPGEQQKSQLAQVDKMMTADIRRMDDAGYCNQWAQKLVNLLLYDNTVQADSKRFFANLASAMGVTGEELRRLYAAATGKMDLPTGEAFGTMAKMFRGMGSPGAADGFAALGSGGTPDDIIGRMAKAFGLLPQYEELVRKRDSGAMSYDQCRNAGIVLTISELCRHLGAPESEIQRRQNSDAIVDYMSEQMNVFISQRAGAKMLNGLVLGPQIMAKMYNFPVPQSEVVYENAEPGSHLGDVLFRADYRLKSVCTFPDAREKMPAHLTDMEFSQREEKARNYELPPGAGAMVGHRLVPADVKMRVSPGGDVVEFQDSRVKVLGWVIGTLGSTNSTARQFIESVTPKYADYLTEHYDEYAAVYPEWHRISELAKVVALARWAKKNNYEIKVEKAADEKVPYPKSVQGFWSMVFQVDENAGSLVLVAHGGASFSPEEGEDWMKAQPDVEVTSDVLKQLAASAVLAKQSVNAIESGDMEAARDLAEKSALAMTGEIDLTVLPTLEGMPSPSDPASYAAATSEVINQASDCLHQMDTAKNDLARAQQIAATSPDEAKKLTEQATKAQDEAQAKLKRIMDGISTYTNDPSQAGGVVLALQSGSGVVMPIGGNATPGTPATPTAGTPPAQGTTTTPATPKEEDWAAKSSKWLVELEEVNKQIESTRSVLLKLNASIQSDRKLFEEWEKDADEGFERSVKMAADSAVDFGIGALADRYDTIYELAKKLPGEPKDVIEKYRYLDSMAHRLKEAKEVSDYAGLAASEGKTDAEIFETMRDGIGQIVGLLDLENKVPVLVAWRYCSLACDMAYNLTELRQLWKNVSVLEGNNERYAEAVKKLTARMQELVARQKELRQKIEAGEPVEYAAL